MKNLVFLLGMALWTTACQNNTENGTLEVALTDVIGSTVAENSNLTGYKIGDEATDFKGFIVIFTCNNCPYAKAYEDRIIALDKKYKPLGFPVIAINPNDPEIQPEDNMDEMKKRALEKGFTFPYLLDEGQAIYPQYGATKTPHVFLLNKENGKNIVKYIGTIDNNYQDASDADVHYVQDAVDALVAGKQVPNEMTVAIGCTIKVKK